MIVAMKKVSVIVQSKDADSALSNLRSLGVLHIEHQKTPKSDDTASIQDNISLLDKAIRILSERQNKKSSIELTAQKLKDWKEQTNRLYQKFSSSPALFFRDCCF